MQYSTPWEGARDSAKGRQQGALPAGMMALRWVIFALLAYSAGCFGMYLWTGEVRFRRRGLIVLKWTILAALGFFAVLIIERLFFFDIAGR